MSRIGVRPIKIEEGVTIETTPSRVKVSCGSNMQELLIPAGLKINIEDGIARISSDGSDDYEKAQHGLFARLFGNAMHGVKSQFTKVLEFNGTGYRAAVEGANITLNMGYSHPVVIAIPENLRVAIVKNTITITGVEKDQVGELAAKIRDVRSPEVYKGKGIKYKGEFIRRKAGKTAASK